MRPHHWTVSVSSARLSAAPGSPPVVRSRRPGWRDPRLAVGLVLVCLSVLLGARLFATADDTVAVLAARNPLVAGQQVSAADLTTVRVRFGSAQAADLYLPADAALPEGTVLRRDVGAGELLPRAGL